MDLDMDFPALEDLAKRARRRVPHFVWEYLDSATGDQSAHLRNGAALDRVLLQPGVLGGEQTVDLSTTFLGRSYAAPIGVAPVGMSGLMWPGAEIILAKLCAQERLPYNLSTVTAATPEDLAPHIGEHGWFQLYPPGDPDIRRDLLKRARDAGFHTMVLTADVAVASRRERQRRAQLRQPMKITPSIMLQAALRPHWSLSILRNGMPKLATLARYGDIDTPRIGTAHVGYLLRTAPDWDYLKALRDEWESPLIIKGVLDPEPAPQIIDAGVDAIWVSNHGGRQFAAAPSGIAALHAMRAAVGPDFPLIYDGAIRSGTDVLRALAVGADFVMLGRAWHHGVAAFGAAGAAQVLHILCEGMKADMGQMAIDRPAQARGRLIEAT
ncbi:MAG: alpha-hydroxy-acid oxidizing protein [Rhodobacteraceae bacterium]|nr:alpha-hydroxy-acid oxidizing protein [Paracoccaceae bacterium]